MKSLLLALFVILSSTSVFAARDSNSPWDERDHGKGGFYFGPRYFLLKDQPYGGLFSSNGFSTPDKNRVGMTFGFFGVSDSDWRYGFDLSFFSLSETTGAPEARFRQILFSGQIGKDFLSDPRLDLILGSGFGFGDATVEVLSPTINGRLVEEYFYVEPSVTVATALGKNFKLGMALAYVYPLELSREAKGQSLGVGQISAQGYSASLQFTFGNFGSGGSGGGSSDPGTSGAKQTSL